MAIPPILPAPRKSAPVPVGPPILPAPPSRQVATRQASHAISHAGSSLTHSLGDLVTPGHTLHAASPKMLQSGNNPQGTRITAPAPGHAGGATLSKVVSDIFHHQDLTHQAAIVAGAQSPKADPHITLAINRAVQSLSADHRMRLAELLPVQKSDVGAFLGKLGQNLNPEHFYGGGATPVRGKGYAVIGNPTMFGGAKGAEHFLKGAGNDLVNLGPNTVAGLYKVGKDAVSGHPLNAVKDVVDPFVQMLMHPAQAFYDHPVNSAMMLAGPEAFAGRAAGSVMRSGVLGDAAKAAASTARSPLRLGPDVAGAPSSILEARSYSPNVAHKGMQVARERRLRKRGFDPNVARPKPALMPKPIANSLNVGLEAKTRRIADEMTSNRQSAGREERGNATHQVESARPHKAVQNIVSHVLQNVIRTPETAIEDITKEIHRLKAADTGVRHPKTIQNRRQVRDLSLALKHPDLIHEAFASADKLRGPSHASDAYLVRHGLLDPEQAMRSRAMPYAMAHMGAKYDHGLGEFVDAHGEPLSTHAILDHIEQSPHKMADPAYVGHYPGKASAFRFYQAYKSARGTAGGVKRTGEAFRSGGYDHTFDGLVAQAARTAETVTKAGLHDHIVNRLGIGKPVGKAGDWRQQALQDAKAGSENGYFTPAEARAYAHSSTRDHHGNEIPGAQPLVPVTAFNARTSLNAIKDLQHPASPEHVDGLELDALNRAMQDAQTRKDSNRNVVLVPAHAMDQFAKQFQPARGGARKLGQITQQFKRTVLPYSTHWMTQIGSEAMLRSTVAGVLDPRNLAAGRQMMHELKNSSAGKAALREMTNASFYNKRDPLAKFNSNPSPTMEGLRHFPPTAAIMKAHNHYADFIGSAIGGLEHKFREMGLGKVSRQQLQEFTGSYQAGVKLQSKNVALLAGELKSDPALVAKFGRQIDDTFGKYNKLSPPVRGAVQSVVPFLPWYLNAAKFVLWNLPVHHPVANALLASLRQTVAQDVQDGKGMPLGPFASEALARFTPWGLFPSEVNSGSLLQKTTEPILPQAMGALNVLHGQNVFGKGGLRGPNGYVKAGTSGTTGPALEALLEALLPGVSKLRTVAEGGGTPYGTSTLWNPQPKPGTSGGADKVLNRLFNPIRGFQNALNATSSTGSSSGSSLKGSIGSLGGGSLQGSLGGGGGDLAASLK